MRRPANTTRRPSSGRDRLISWAFALLAVGLLAAAGWVYIRDRQEEFSPAPEPDVPGANEMINVYNAFREAGFDVAYGSQAARIDGVNQPGQQLIVDGVPVWAFVFVGQETGGGVDQRATVTASLDAASLTLTSPSGQPIDAGDVSIISRSNVFVIVSGEASPDQRDQIAQAVETLA